MLSDIRQDMTDMSRIGRNVRKMSLEIARLRPAHLLCLSRPRAGRESSEMCMAPDPRVVIEKPWEAYDLYRTYITWNHFNNFTKAFTIASIAQLFVLHRLHWNLWRLFFFVQRHPDPHPWILRYSLLLPWFPVLCACVVCCGWQTMGKE